MTTFTLEQVEQLLIEQTALVTNRLMNNSSSYNANNTDSTIGPLSINREEFLKLGMETEYPRDIRILKKYSC